MPRAAPVTWNTAIKVIWMNPERNFSVWENYLDERLLASGSKALMISAAFQRGNLS